MSGYPTYQALGKIVIDSPEVIGKRLKPHKRMVTTLDKKPKRSGCLDRFLLVGAALLVCIVGGAAFLTADIYHINAMWVFFLWNSLFMIPVFNKSFRGQLRKPAFVVFLIGWGIFHGFLVVVLMRRTPVVVWFLTISFELYVGFLLAEWMFGVQPRSNLPD